MTRVVVCGICGRMGTMVARALQAAGDLTIVAGVERPGHAHLGKRLCDLSLGLASDAPVLDDVAGCPAADYDVIVDFSSPAQAAVCAQKAAADLRGIVVGTTGLSGPELTVIEEASRAAPVVLAPNMSVGVNVLFELSRLASRMLGPEFDVEIVEAHHRAKRDAPSGTAVRLLEIVADARGLESARAARLGRSGLTDGREGGEIGVHSIRAGRIIGRHEVSFVSDVEEVRVAHEATSREAFAAGAVRAARYVHGRRPGLYDMADVLGLGESR